jgi:ribonuclease-3
VDNTAEWLLKTFAYQFQDLSLLEDALTHRSVGRRNNERLEFLGDAILDFVVSDMIFRNRPEADEGDLSRLRASLVKDTRLAEIAASIGLGEYLILGSGERKSGAQRRGSILADALEAIFGAIYLDAGFAAVDNVIRRVFGALVNDLPDSEELKDPKSRLQEFLQGSGYALPEYRVETVSGEAHKQLFDVSCSAEELQLIARGHGTTRRDAEQEAAANMLSQIEAANQ